MNEKFSEKKDNILEVKNLTKKFSLESGFFARKDRFVYALNNVSFEIERGKTYGLVGESGCGKSTVAKLLVGMYKADSGKIVFKSSENRKNENEKNSSMIKYIFQDPARSLNPRMTVFSILTDGLKHEKKGIKKEELKKLAEEIL